MLTFSLEEATDHEPSVENKCSLNEFLVKLRPLIKKAKKHVLHYITRRTTAINKKLEHKDNPKLKKKKENALCKLKILRKINRDRLCKQVLSLSLDNRCPESHSDFESQAVALLYERPVIKREIQRFKTEHSDWEDLINYILYKNTSGKLKKRPQKKNATKRKGAVPYPQLPNGLTYNIDLSASQQKPALSDKESDLGECLPSDEPPVTLEICQNTLVSSETDNIDKHSKAFDNHSNFSHSNEEEKKSEASFPTNDEAANFNNSGPESIASNDDTEGDEEDDNEDDMSDSESGDESDKEAIVSAVDDSDSDNPLGEDDQDMKPSQTMSIDPSDYRTKKIVYGGSTAPNRSFHSNSFDNQRTNNYRNSFTSRPERSHSQNPNRNFSDHRKPNDLSGRFNSRQFPSSNYDTKPVNDNSIKPAPKDSSPVVKDMHPSWKAKQEQKQKLKISISAEPTVKKIKF